MDIEVLESNELSSIGAPKENPPLTEEEKNLYERIKKASAAIPDLPQAASPKQKRNLGLVACELGVKADRFMNEKIHGQIQEASDLRKTLDQLVNLNGKLAMPAEGEEKAITPEIRELCKELKAKGIDLLTEKDQKISRERLAEIKANISAQTERIKTDLQVLFVTKIPVDIQGVHTVFDCMKMIEKYSRSTAIIHNMKNGG